MSAAEARTRTGSLVGLPVASFSVPDYRARVVSAAMALAASASESVRGSPLRRHLVMTRVPTSGGPEAGMMFSGRPLRRPSSSTYIVRLLANRRPSM